MAINKEALLGLIAQLDDKNLIEFVILTCGMRHYSSHVAQFEVFGRGAGWVLAVHSLPASAPARGTVADLRQAIQLAPASALVGIKLVDARGGWGWVTGLTYPLLLSKTDDGTPLMVVRCQLDDFCDFDGKARFDVACEFYDPQGLLLD
ncbi:hypothetical protein HA052_04480 [Chromobacterium haemolyticum]|uniref:Uncharacterized protein n=1 Tax=Chromobacterium fluminis TaxID=3044269 RepID=A0ABX0KY22_9NEIS|nr:hypothetical protein [Chromobacterium haemolyticum]NHR04447.1 hypothetical protein [Chromobacterium haemolyticum]